LVAHIAWSARSTPLFLRRYQGEAAPAERGGVRLGADHGRLGYGMGARAGGTMIRGCAPDAPAPPRTFHHSEAIMSTFIEETGTVTLLNESGIQSIAPGTYTSTTDGFAYGIVNGAVSADGPAFTWITGSCGPITAVASGGQFALSVGNPSGALTGAVAAGTSFMLPVPANNAFTLAVNPLSNNGVNPVVSLFFIPMGNGQLSAS
jgi:hypothetical protein